MEITKNDLKKLETKISKEVNQLDLKVSKEIKESEQRFEKHTNVLYEKFRGDMKIMAEGWDATRKKTDATFEMVGGMKEDVEIIKMEISFIKNGLKQKADKDELEALEKRVMFLENKFKRV